MHKVWNLKKQQALNEKSNTKVSPSRIRIQKDVSELDLPSSIKVEFLDQQNLNNFIVQIKPDEGYYSGGTFKFSFALNENYPHDPPKVLCLNKIYHPNIDLDGKVCLNILREDWKPVLTLNSVLIGLQFLFLEPNPEDPLNKVGLSDLV
ncbi:NEDD8-conjugating enzyme ubc12 [Smittium culicis]|uniref:NEDD8-conjugating enzyme UBC12 n=1 Tax=Smittium culicis TaxID=133412 RepID=A0A1R1X4P0_9FUNG|nr:NEDD8-conjugating enzyme ubc12 [Smittium culicis]